MSAYPALRAPADDPAGMHRVCAFTLATALAWLGHDCPGGCPAPAGTVHATVWYVRPPTCREHGNARTLVLVELAPGASEAASVHGMLAQVNACTRSDHIRVRELIRNDSGLADAGEG